MREDLSRGQVKSKLAGCEACQRIDLALRSENFVPTGSLSVEGNWHRVAVDVTHYEGRLFLSMVDCGPSRFATRQSLQITLLLNCEVLLLSEGHAMSSS